MVRLLSEPLHPIFPHVLIRKLAQVEAYLLRCGLETLLLDGLHGLNISQKGCSACCIVIANFDQIPVEQTGHLGRDSKLDPAFSLRPEHALVEKVDVLLALGPDVRERHRVAVVGLGTSQLALSQACSMMFAVSQGRALSDRHCPFSHNARAQTAAGRLSCNRSLEDLPRSSAEATTCVGLAASENRLSTRCR